jgi:hypothetical protein
MRLFRCRILRLGDAAVTTSAFNALPEGRIVRSRLLALLLGGLLSACGGGESAPFGPQAVTLPIPNELQQQTSWCWVATSRQVIASLPNGPGASTPSQCMLASDALGAQPGFCCQYPAMCDVPGTMQQQQYLIAKYGGRYSAVSPPTDPVTLYQTIASGYAVILLIRGSGLVGHFVVLRGMFWQNGVPYVVVNDPMSFFPTTYPFNLLLPYWQAAIVVA